MSTAIVPAALSMSSREIAELTGKPHNDVLKKIRKQLKELGIDEGKFSSVYLDAKNEARTEYQLDHLQTMNLITGYNVVLRSKVNERWMALEEAAKEYRWLDTRESLKEAWWEVQDVIKLYYGEPKGYDYANEQNMVYNIIFGMSAKQLRRRFGLHPDEPAKDGMTEVELESVAALESANSLFMQAGMAYAERKVALKRLHTANRKKLS